MAAKKWNVEIPLEVPDAEGNTVKIVKTFKQKKEAKEFVKAAWGAENGWFNMVRADDE